MRAHRPTHHKGLVPTPPNQRSIATIAYHQHRSLNKRCEAQTVNCIHQTMGHKFTSLYGGTLAMLTCFDRCSLLKFKMPSRCQSLETRQSSCIQDRHYYMVWHMWNIICNEWMCVVGIKCILWHSICHRWIDMNELQSCFLANLDQCFVVYLCVCVDI
jgi:hypothetical protein